MTGDGWRMVERQTVVGLRSPYARVEVWVRDDRAYGVALIDDEFAVPAMPTFMSGEDAPEGFPPRYDPAALMAWGREEWQRLLSLVAS